MKQRILLLAVSFAICVSAIQAQREFAKADKLFGLKAFDLAIENYISALQKYPAHAEGYAKLADAYSMKNDLLSAISTYEKALSLGVPLEDKYKLQYAQALKKVGLYDKAKHVYEAYATTNEIDAAYHLAGIEEAKNLLQRPDGYDVLLFEGNSASSDFGMSFFKGKKVFCSFRDDLKRETDKKNDSYIQTTGNQIYTFENEEVEFLRPDFKENYYIGPLSYSKDGRMVAFMRNTFSNGCTKIFTDEADMSIYIAMTDENGDFADPKPFPYNELQYAYGFPNLSSDNNALYFASNREGGYGGFDIYVSHLRDGEWTKPENLGESINSAGNEVSPFVANDRLYFSSDLHLGLGGYDIFESKFNNGTWAAATNAGKGINSPSDDYYLAIDPADGGYYFTSNRLGGRGNDDIYVAYDLSTYQDDLVATPIVDPDDYEKDIPKAVNLEEMTSPMADVANEEAVGASRDIAVAVPVSSEEVISILKDEAVMDNYEGAVLTGITRLAEEIVDDYATSYFVQLAAYAQSSGDLNSFQQVKDLGQLFRFYKSSTVKIRLGNYTTREEADRVLASVKSKGFLDAFVTADVLANSTYEIVGEGKSKGWIDDYSPATSFKVKLASYKNPLNFDVDRAIDLGRLEQWTKGKFTIFILGGFESYETAKQALIKAKNKGFIDAALVEDDHGILKNVQMR